MVGPAKGQATQAAIGARCNKSIEFCDATQYDTRFAQALATICNNFVEVFSVHRGLQLVQFKHGKGCLVRSPCVLEALGQLIVDRSNELSVLRGISVYFDRGYIPYFARLSQIGLRGKVGRATSAVANT